MKRCAVAIGVNKTGGLPVLSAAARGAHDFSAWAKSQGIDVTTLTDDNGPVCVADIKSAIKGYVKQGTYDQMIVYFSGHGYLNGPDLEIWLLSEANEDADEAVNVSGSVLLARNSGIPHLVFFSDACRSRPTTDEGAQITGSKIFPNEPVRMPRPSLDIFYGTLPGDASFEVPPDSSVTQHRGIFTDCVLRGLRGEAKRVSIDDGRAEVIVAHNLEEYLEEEVPEAASEANIQLVQNPEIIATSKLPQFIAVVMPEVAAAPPPAAAPAPPPMAAPPPPSDDDRRDAAVPRMRPLPQRPKMLPRLRPGASAGAQPKRSIRREIDLMRHVAFNREPEPQGAMDWRKSISPSISDAMDRIVEAQGRLSFETRTGFSVVGADVIGAVVSRGVQADVFVENNTKHVRVHKDEVPGARSLSCLLVLPSEKSIVLGVIPGFIGTAVFQDEKLMTVNYTPSRYTDKYGAYEHHEKEIAERRAFAAVAAANGLFKFKDREQAINAGNYLRIEKGIDPTLGIYAAYAYAEADMIQDAESVFKHMSYEPEPIPFDVALAAGQIDDLQYGKLGHPITPFCPMMSRGWSWLPDEGKPDILKRLSSHLVPGLWTVFTPKGTEVLRQAFHQGEV